MKEGSLLFQLIILAALIAGIATFIHFAPPLPEEVAVAPTEEEMVATSTSATSEESAESASVVFEEKSDKATTTAVQTAATAAAASAPAAPAAQNGSNQVHRIESPYSTPPLRFETVNVMARSALVNIFCSSNSGLLRPISGSGTIIDPDGIVLTNAHVAQYVLLAESGRVNMQCTIRTGSPAAPKWTARMLFMPTAWVEAHAADLRKERPLGTGKYDYALLYIGSSVDGQLRPDSFPHLSVDSREAIGFVDDPVLTASYPAEFLGSIATSFNLYPVTSTSVINDLHTLGAGTVDVISVGNVLGAQSGSSGGGIVNAWGQLIGVVTTTTDGKTTGERQLRGITLSYISRDIAAQSGTSLSSYLDSDPAVKAAEFHSDSAPALVDLLIAQIK